MHQIAASLASRRLWRPSFPTRGPPNDLTATFTYSPASQIGSVTRTNDAYAWTGHGSGSTASVANGLNQLTSVGGGATAHDARGNLTTDPTTGKTYSYSSENLLTASTGGTAASLTYDPAMRLYQLTGAATTRFGYDGTAMIAEYDGANALQRRFVHGPGVDEPLVHYEGSGTTDRRWLHADERGSIIAISDGGGNVTTINRYDEYGKPQSSNVGRFQYTGQTWLGELGLYYYKARMYGPHLGRFWQTDPIGFRGGINWYGYVRNDPINRVDPFGRCSFTLWTIMEQTWNSKTGQYNPPVDTRQRFVTNDTPCDNPVQAANTAQELFNGGGDAAPQDDECSGDEESSENCAIVVKAQLVPRVGPPPSTLFVRPPWYVMRPPGWSNRWQWGPSPRRPGKSGQEPRWIDPKGGEWRYHSKDKDHNPHWDYNPNRGKDSPWQRIPISEGPAMIASSGDQYEDRIFS